MLRLVMPGLVLLGGLGCNLSDARKAAVTAAAVAQKAMGCESHAECGRTEICDNHECVTAVDRSYTLVFEHLALSPRKPNGQPWDFAGGAPDPFYVVTLNGKQACKSAVTHDTFEVAATYSCALVLKSGSEVAVFVYDDDLTEPDRMLGIAWSGNDAIESLARASGMPATILDRESVKLRLRVDR